jgi:hypothetical protein
MKYIIFLLITLSTSLAWATYDISLDAIDSIADNTTRVYVDDNSTFFDGQKTAPGALTDKCDYWKVSYEAEYSGGQCRQPSQNDWEFATYSGTQVRMLYFKENGTDPYDCASSGNTYKVPDAYWWNCHSDQTIGDQDGDGLADDVDDDPWVAATQADPNTTPTDFFEAKKAYDENGNLIYSEIWKANEYGEIIEVEQYGDENAYNDIKAGLSDGTIIEDNPFDNPFTDPLNSNVRDISELDQALATDINGEYEGNTPLETSDNEVNYDSNEDLTDGQTDPGSQTTTEQLDYTNQFSTMIDNQNTQISNQQKMADRQDTSNKLLAEIADNTSKNNTAVVNGEYDGPTADEIADSVVGETDGQLNPDTSSLDTAETGAQDAFNTANDLTVDAPTEYQQKTDIDEKIDAIETDQTVTDIKDIFTNTQVQATGDPCFYYDYKGHTIDFCVDNFQSQLNTWGLLMVSISGLHALLIVFRRR